MTEHRVFVTGSTGHMGRHLIPELVRAGHTVRALVRKGSEGKLPIGCEPFVGDALDASSYAKPVSSFDTFVHLVGVTHPNPSKAEEFNNIDFKSMERALVASKGAAVSHFVYVSVAQPAPVMKAYIAVRARAEAMIRESRLNATILRPWYVLGPGRRWPLLLVPMYWLLEKIPATRESSKRLGLVTIQQMVAAMVASIENPLHSNRIVDVEQIRQSGLNG